LNTQVDRLKAEVYQSSRNARIKLFSPPVTYKLMNASFLKMKPQDRELPALEELVDRPDIDTISDIVDSVIQTDDRLAKQIKLYFCHRYSGLKLKEIGKYFGIGESGVSQTSRRLSDKLKRNKNLSKKVAILKKKLKLWRV